MGNSLSGAQASTGAKRSHQQDFKFLIVGETGAGKTSFLNFLCNLPSLQVEREKEARGERAYENWEQLAFNKQANERKADQSKSQTLAAHTYKIVGFGVEVTAIDTPGLADTGGLKIDEEHMKTLENSILAEKYINCICLVVNGAFPRKTAQILYVVSRLTALMPKEIIDQIVVVYTRTETWDLLEFDPSVIEKIIGRKIPDNHQFCFDNPYACIELIKQKRKAKGSGKGYDPKSTVLVKQKFAHTMDTIGELFTNLQNFAPIGMQSFEELFQAKATIDRECDVYRNRVKEITQYKRDVINAQAAVKNAADWKRQMSNYEASQKYEESETTNTTEHHMVCQKCNKVCHQNCEVEKAIGNIYGYKKCKCFSHSVDKPVILKTEMDRQALLGSSEDFRCNGVANIETFKSGDSQNSYLLVKKNLDVGGVRLIGNPHAENNDAATTWLPQTGVFTGAHANNYTTENLRTARLGSTINFRDWSNMLLGENMPCQDCGCPARNHNHQNYMIRKVTRDKTIINEGMKKQYDNYASEEQQKSAALKQFQETLDNLKIQEEQSKTQMRKALHVFKTKSTATSYVRVLSRQVDFIRLMIDNVEADPTITNEVRKDTLAGLREQVALLEDSISVLHMHEDETVREEAPKKKKRVA